MEQIAKEVDVPTSIVAQMDYNNSRLFECLNLSHLILKKLIGKPLPDDEFAVNGVNCLVDQIMLSKNLIVDINKKLEEILHAIDE